MVVTIPDKNIKTQLVMEIVEFSSTTSKESFPIWDDYVNGVTVEDLKEISRSKAYDECRNFQNLLRKQAKKNRLDLFHNN